MFPLCNKLYGEWTVIQEAHLHLCTETPGPDPVFAKDFTDLRHNAFIQRLGDFGTGVSVQR